jgi:hypothetical protein
MFVFLLSFPAFRRVPWIGLAVVSAFGSPLSFRILWPAHSGPVM